MECYQLRWPRSQCILYGAVTLAWATFRCLWASAAWHATGRKSAALCRNEHLSDSGSSGVLGRWA